MLGDVLRQCEAGMPMEYLELQVAAPLLSQRFGTEDFAVYLAHLFARRTSTDGIFGFKVHWHQLTAFFRALNGGVPYDARVHASVLRQVVEDLFPALTWVHLSRRDVEAQARSLHRAETTGVFADLDGTATRPAIPEDPAAVARHVQTLRAQERAWIDFFAAAGLEPLHVVYEDLVRAMPATVTGVLDHVGAAVPDRIPEPSTRRQSAPSVGAPA